MKKIETIWHHLLYSAVEKKQFKFTQQELATQFQYSLSTVNHALKIPTANGAIRKTSKFFILEDVKKLLYYWASIRNLDKDIIYQTYIETSVLERESIIPPTAVIAGYTAAKYCFKEPPADYDKLYFYLSEDYISEVEKRYPHNKNQANNVFVLKIPQTMSRYGQVTTIIQTFVDLWNCHDWYAKDFIKRLEEEIDDLLS